MIRVERIKTGDEVRVLEAAYLFDRAPESASTRAYLADDRNYLLLAYVGDDGPAAGFVRGTTLGRPDGPERQLFLYEIAVAPEYQRRGVGTALIQELERICRDEGMAEMFVFTNRSNTAAMRLYASAGGHIEADDEQMFVWTYLPGFEG
jgi:ribosomal protein S18 acetylase RimI-like enzyme